VFNDKEVDEILILDIDASRGRRSLAFDLIEEIAAEAFMPMCYGGGVRSMDDLDRLFRLGVEKVALNTVAIEDPDLVSEASRRFGRQSIVGCIDVKRHKRTATTFVRSGTVDTTLDPVAHALRLMELGVGEILLQSVDRDGMRCGYDLTTIASVAAVVGVPVIALGGAGSLRDCCEAIEAGASAVAAGSMFVFHGKRQAVLISYPPEAERSTL
jgi:cyclase